MQPLDRTQALSGLNGHQRAGAVEPALPNPRIGSSAPTGGVLRRIVDALPRGRTLPEEVWLRRHRALLAILWLHALGLTIFAALRGYSVGHVAAHAAGLVALASIAQLLGRNRRAASAAVSLGLITSSALLVHSWNGVIEAHFHFFVMIALLALYEDWFPFLLAAAYVVLHHGVAGAIDPTAVYNHPDAIEHPWKWAAIHGGFVFAAGAAGVVTWRLNEDVRAETQDAYARARESEQRFKSAFADAPIGMVLASIEPERAGQFLQVNRAMCELTGYAESQLIGKHFGEITHPDDVAENQDRHQMLIAGELPSYQLTKRYVHASGQVVWAQLNVSLVRDGGKPLYSIAQVQDISERRRAGVAVEESRRQLAEAQKLAQIGSWEWNIETGAVSWSDEFYRILGLQPAEEIATYEGVFERVYPDDRERVNEIVESAMANGSPFECELRMVRSDGEARMIDAYGVVVVDPDLGTRTMVGTAQDVTERRQVERELGLRAETEREHKARSEFLSRISHELRTPLNAILGFAQLLELDELEEQQRENVQLIRKGGHHLLELINEVLEISRIEAGNMTVSLEPVDVVEVVAETIDLLEPLAAEQGVSLENKAKGDDGRFVEADNQRLKQVLLNLLSNGIKYNQEGGAVKVSVENVSSDRVLILVTDTGKGIPSDKLARVFSPFDRLGAEETAVEGTGLGLTLSKLLVEAMDGTLGVESEPWIGTTFIIGLNNADAPRVSKPSGRHSEAVAGKGSMSSSAVVLYVEDNLSNFKLVEQTLKRRSRIRLLAAMDGGLGFELARQHRPELILLDLNLPGMGGEEVLRRLKEDPLTARSRVVVVSADATSSRIERVLAAGAESFLTKPIDVTRLLAIVDETVGQGAAV